jgi:hypothetical protein
VTQRSILGKFHKVGDESLSYVTLNIYFIRKLIECSTCTVIQLVRSVRGESLNCLIDI